MYHRGSRAFQDQFDTRRLADRLELVQMHTTFTEEDCDFIQQSSMFFLATADAEGRPDCSYKGGLAGFVRVLDERTLAFPDYDGNGMFKSLGNILLNPHVGLLFIDFEHPARLRINGTASIRKEYSLLAAYAGAQLIVYVHAEHIFPNCPRYIHKMHFVEHSMYVPQTGYSPPVPTWKKKLVFRGVLPRMQRTLHTAAKVGMSKLNLQKGREDETR